MQRLNMRQPLVMAVAHPGLEANHDIHSLLSVQRLLPKLHTTRGQQ